MRNNLSSFQPSLTIKNNKLYFEKMEVERLGEKYGTPLYIYSKTALVQAYQEYEDALQGTQHLICYAVKANNNLAILKTLRDLDSGFDVVSLGELKKLLFCKVSPKRIVFSGVGKSEAELETAIRLGLKSINVESEPEFEKIALLAQKLKKKVAVSIRVNPDIDAKTHPKISTGLKINKFGLDITSAKKLYKKASVTPYIQIAGIDFHIGSQITTLSPIKEAIRIIFDLIIQLEKTLPIRFSHIDFGGGLGVAYDPNEKFLSPSRLIKTILQYTHRYHLTDREILVEPGRSIVANAGVLLTQVLYIKKTPYKTFAIVDAGMNDLIRPALYDASMPVFSTKNRTNKKVSYDIVGPICESSDFIQKGYRLSPLKEKDFLVVGKAGAYGYSMSSNYNLRGRPAEIWVTEDKVRLIRQREKEKDLWQNENF